MAEHLVNQPDQVYSVQLPGQLYAVQTSSQPYSVQINAQSYLAKTSTEPFSVQPSSLVDSKPVDFIKEVLCQIVWLFIMFVGFLFEIFFFILCNTELRIDKVIGCIAHFIILYLVVFSADIHEPKNYYIALGLFIMWSVSLIIITIKYYAELDKKYYHDVVVIRINIGEIFLELVTLCVFCCYKKKFDKLNLLKDYYNSVPQLH